LIATKIKKYVLPFLPYIAIFWFFGKLGEAYRLTPSNDTITKLMGSLTGLNAAMSRPMPSFHPQDMIVGLIGAAAVFIVVYVRKKNAKNWRKDIEYGSARWGVLF
jgi:type IV secretion system protein VirD4